MKKIIVTIISIVGFILLLLTVAFSFSQPFKQTIITETIVYNIYDFTSESYMYNEQLMYPVVLGSELQQASFVEGRDIEKLLTPTNLYYIRQETELNQYSRFRMPWENAIEIYDTFKEAKVVYHQNE